MQPLAPSARPPFSWTKGLLHVTVVFGLLMVLSVIVVTRISSKAVRVRVVETVVRGAFWAILLTLGASYAFQTRRKILGGIVLILAGVFALALLNSATQSMASATDEAPSTAGERERPARDARLIRIPARAIPCVRFAPGSAWRGAGRVRKRIRGSFAKRVTSRWGADKQGRSAPKGIEIGPTSQA